MKKIIFIIIIILIAIQFIPVNKTNPPINQSHTLVASDEVMHLLKKSCYDCHSFETKWPAYSNIAPLSWGIVDHVEDGREALNFSEWTKIKNDIKIKRLKRSIQTINNGMMPLPSYLKFHDEALLSDAEKKVVVDWCYEELKK
ncbi:MAG: heme-binding domain-containing protein [Epsilonproteobacteria bacterium]|nr:heme-binding domain-containing protein [Campylobacterota bacterium]